MYTLSALWTQARENLDITTVMFSNGAYDILRVELQRVGAQTSETQAAPGPRAEALLDLGNPTIDFVALASGMGVPARKATTATEFSEALAAALAEPGPHLIDAVIPALMGSA
jgi:acetolactate synthase-1/2/3 large subunit